MDRYPFASDYAASLGLAPDPDALAREEQLAYQDPFPGSPRSSRPVLPAGLGAAPLPKRLALEPAPPRQVPQATIPARLALHLEPFPRPGSDLAERQAQSRVSRTRTGRPTLDDSTLEKLAESVSLSHLLEMVDAGQISKSELQRIARMKRYSGGGPLPLPEGPLPVAAPEIPAETTTVAYVDSVSSKLPITEDLLGRTIREQERLLGRRIREQERLLAAKRQEREAVNSRIAEAFPHRRSRTY